MKLLLSHQATSKEDLGKNFGSEAEPMYDEDLDAELNLKEIRTEKQLRAKEGIDYDVEEDENGELFQVTEQEEGD